MKKKNSLCLALCLLAAFVLWTVIVSFVDVKPIGPMGSKVGLSALNEFMHNLTGVHMWLYIATDWLGILPILVAFAFGVLGLVQWIKRKKLCRVDGSIMALGVFYIAVIAAYITFEKVVINYRPVLIEGILEASYPSSTTLLVMCVMVTAVMQFNSRIKNKRVKRCVRAIIIAFTVFMVAARCISGVHWFTDIIGSMLLSGGLILLYRSISKLKA